VQDRVEQRMREVAEHIAQGFGAEIAWRYERRYPATINSEAETALAREAAVAAFGEAAFRADLPQTMGAEDFAFMLQEKPGAYAMIGNGPSEGGRNLHSPHYDFNDEVLPLGVRYWLAVVDRYLGARQG
jgi:hippurate hydrolase